MEKQMRAERDRRAAILQAEGVKQSQILTAEGEKQSAILRAEGQRESQRLYAEGQARAIETVFAAIHAGNADPKLLAYQYLQMLPQIAQGEANKVWIIPSEITQAIGSRGAPRAIACKHDVRHALRTPPERPRRRPLARQADRGRRQQGDARDPPRAARGRRQLPGRQAVHGGREGARPRRGRARV